MVETVKKTLEIMSYIVNSSKSVKVSDVARTFNMSVSNASRYLKIFEQYGIVIRKRDGSYIPGFKLVEFGSIILKRISLREIAHPYLVDLMVKTDQTVHLVLKEGYEGVYIEKLESAKSLPMISRIGMRMPLYSTGFGKAILAYLPEEELEDFLKNVRLLKRTERTITDPEKLKEELRRIRKRGYAIDNEENEDGVKCIGAPIINHEGKPIAAVSIAGAAIKFTEEWIKRNAVYVVNCAREISKKLGSKF